MNKKVIPNWFWIVSAILLLWNAMGIFAFISDMTISESALQAKSAAEQALYTGLPLWVKIAYGTAVFGGAAGCILLLLRNKMARPIFILSLLAIIGQMTYSLFVQKSTEVYGPGAVVMPIMVMLIGCFLVWFSRYAHTKNWIK